MPLRSHDRQYPMIRLVLSSLMSLACAILATGCHSTPDTSPGTGKGDTYPAPMNDPQISVLDPSLRKVIVFQPANITREASADRILNVQVPVRNITETQFKIEYRYLFFDGNGRQLEPVQGWKGVLLDPKQVARLEGPASLVDARDYRLEVRWQQ